MLHNMVASANFKHTTNFGYTHIHLLSILVYNHLPIGSQKWNGQKTGQRIVGSLLVISWRLLVFWGFQNNQNQWFFMHTCVKTLFLCWTKHTPQICLVNNIIRYFVLMVQQTNTSSYINPIVLLQQPRNHSNS